VTTNDQRLTQLEQQLAALHERIVAIEDRTTTAQKLIPTDMSMAEALQQRAGRPYEDGATRGAVAYAGAVQFADAEYTWQIERPLPGLLALDVTTLVPVLAALGSGPRLVLVRALLECPRSSQELQEALGTASVGQLYHHLKELLAAGIIEQRERSVYRLAARKIVPFLAVLAGAYDLGEGGAATDSPPL
jgi:DNA-binding transcriptional ArsR family regulator